MIPPISPAGERFVNSVNEVQARLNVAEQQISSGLKVSSVTDAPDQVSPILQLHAEIQKNLDIQTGLQGAQSELQTGDSALSNAVGLLQSASALATEGLGITQTAETRATLAESAQGLLQQMVSISQTTFQGRYIFSGDQDQQPLYQTDLAAAGGVDRLQVAGATRRIRGVDGDQFQAGLSANTIFDRRDGNDNPTADNVFAAVNHLRVALAANDTAGIQTAVSSLGAASTYLNDQLAFYGNAQNRVAAAIATTQSRDTDLRSNLSSKTDADLTAAITELTQGQTQLQATLSARARMPQTSLFDYLPQS